MDFKKSSICDSMPVALSEVRLVWCGLVSKEMNQLVAYNSACFLTS